MSEAKFTPGPWAAETLHPRTPEWDKWDIWHGEVLVSSMVDGEANASLIKEAPAMYELLEELKGYFEPLIDAEFFTDSARGVPNTEMQHFTAISEALCNARGVKNG